MKDSDIDFVIIVGELTRNADVDEFNAVKYIMDNSPVPVYVSGSNHDLVGNYWSGRHDDYARFKSILGVQPEYAITKGRSRFIFQSHSDSVGYDFVDKELAKLEDDTSYDFVYQITESAQSGIEMDVKPFIGITGGNGREAKCLTVRGRHPRFNPLEHKDREDEDDYFIVKENDGYILLDSYVDHTLDKTWKVDVNRSAGTGSVAEYTYPADYDVNGVSSSWLKSYGLKLTNAETLVDTDGDGLTNLEEYIAGKNPLVNDSSPEIRVTEYYLT
ncbi:MAG: hypothetical protein NE330_20925, partial [Lentisphaeraceae bacterium]|nr:hypothetical protein [Lentisphaeraceae bacterium]